MFENIFGSDRGCLLQAVDCDMPSHAYLFYGGVHDVLRDSAQEFIANIVLASSASSDAGLISERIRDGFFSDLYTVERDGSSVKIEAVRKIKTFLRSKPLEGLRRYVLIDYADYMTEHAQNALLKILEEPYSDSVLVLLAETTDALLDTVLSRVQLIRVMSLTVDAVRLNMDQKLYLAQKFEEIFLSGDVNALFELSSVITKDRQHASDYVYFIYSYFLYVSKTKIHEEYYNGYYEPFRLLTDQTSMDTAQRLLQVSLRGMRNLDANASIELAIDAMLIEMQEEFHAENCRS